MKTHFPLCYHHTGVSAQCVCALSPRMWFAFVLRFSCWGKQLDGRIKSERESLLLHCLHQICHELMRWSQIRPVSLTPAPSRLTRSNRSHRQTERANIYIWVYCETGAEYVSFWSKVDPCSSSPDCLIVSNSRACIYAQKLWVANCVVRRLDFTALLSAKEKCVLNSSINLLISPPVQHCQSQHTLSGEALCSLSVQSYGALMGNLKHIASTPQHM